MVKMNNTNSISIFKGNVFKIVLWDLLLFTGVYFIPIISHATSIPIYLVDPMRLMLFILIFFAPEIKLNHFLVALTLPLVSYVFSGHPVLLKSVIMSIELVLNVAIFHGLIKRTNVFISIAVSIIISKVVYYLMKFTLISCGLVNMDIMSTGFFWQMTVVIVLSSLGTIVTKKSEKI